MDEDQKIVIEKIDPVTEKQSELISKLLESPKLRDNEYREMRDALDKQVVTKKDASILISHALATVRFSERFRMGEYPEEQETHDKERYHEQKYGERVM